MNRRSTPEADAQRAIVQTLRFALPRDAIVHHAANEIAAGDRRGQVRQSILVGMGPLCQASCPLLYFSLFLGWAG